MGDSDVDRRSIAPAENDQREAAAQDRACFARLYTTMGGGGNFPKASDDRPQQGRMVLG